MNPRKIRSSVPVTLILLIGLVAMLIPGSITWATHEETVFGEMEGRTAPVSRRECVGGPNVGQLCNEDADCAASTCQDRNIFNMTVAVKFNATAAQLTTIQNVMDDFAASLFDATDGQAQLGQITIVNNAVGTGGDIWVQPGSGLSANSGHWGVGGKIFAGLSTLQFGANPGEGLAHEFVHLVLDARDEYESRAAGCGAVVGGAQCPTDPDEERCLMDQGGTAIISTELCWSGNHEPALVTEQSRCRSNRACWDQIGHAWPNTFLVPAGAPDPEAGGAVVDPVVYFTPDSSARLVLVLDNSGSMSAESPSRMDRLKTAAADFVTIAENGTELGIVSFTTTAVDEVAIASLGVNRVAYLNAINNLTPTFRTNVGDGLQHAKNMIDAAGGVTSNTAIILMTDGLNNEPPPNPQVDLDAKIAMLLAAGIPVLVTCTGDDLGLNSQCQEIAAGTMGTYVDSADSADLPEAFAQFHELAIGAQLVASQSGPSDPQRGAFQGSTGGYEFMVEEGASSVAVTLQWNTLGTEASLVVLDPTGFQYQGQSMPLGQFVRVRDPEPGDWSVLINFFPSNEGDSYVSQAFVKNMAIGIAESPRFQVVQSNGEMVVYVHPNYLVPLTDVVITGHVTKPDGMHVPVELFDDGRTAADTGDDAPDDGMYTQTFRDTLMPGAYKWHLIVDARNARVVDEFDADDQHDVDPVPYIRELLFTATVNDRVGSQICVNNGFGEPGDTATVPITLSEGDGVAGFQVELLYDPTVLSPVSVTLGADTAAAGGWAVAGSNVGPGDFRVLGASNPPAGLPAGAAEVALVKFNILAGVPNEASQLDLAGCILSDDEGLELLCQICPEPGSIVVRPASSFEFQPVAEPVGVDLFDPLPFIAGVSAINAFGGLATAYNGTADMVIPDGICASSLQPNSLSFVTGVGSGFFRVPCCIDPLLPNSTLPLKIEATDPTFLISGTSAAFRGAAKGDLDANNSVDVLDTIRTTQLSLNNPVGLPPSMGFQKWAGDMLGSTCTPDGANNVLDVVRVSNKALGLPPLCVCDDAANQSAIPVTASSDLRAQPAVHSAGPVRFRLKRAGGGRLLLKVSGAEDLGGFQFDLPGAGAETEVVLDGLTEGGDWVVATSFHEGVLRVIAYSTTATGVSGDGTVLRIQTDGPQPLASRPRLSGIVASDSRGEELKTY